MPTSTTTTAPALTKSGPVVEWTLDPDARFWDLKAKVTTTLHERPGGDPPVDIVHEDQEFIIRTRVELQGNIRHYLCGKLCMSAGFESIGLGPDYDLYQDVELKPCGDGVYNFELVVPAGRLLAGHCGKIYAIGLTLGSFDYCGHPGFLFGKANIIDIAVVPAIVH